MGRFIVRRLLTAIPVLLGILALVFGVARLIPGDPCTAALGERATDEICDAYNVRYGLDESIPKQFQIYITDVAQGDLGDSFRFNKPVTDLLIERLPTTLELSLAALTLAVLVGIPLGVISAYRHNSKVDVATMIGANIGVSMPVFWLGLMLQYLFAVKLATHGSNCRPRVDSTPAFYPNHSSRNGGSARTESSSSSPTWRSSTRF